MPADQRSPPRDQRHAGRIRTLLVDDSAIMVKTLRRLLTMKPDFDLVGIGGNGREAVDLAARLRPDLVLIDLRMPEMDGLEATRLIKRQTDPPVVVIVTVHDDNACRVAAAAVGADGFVCKTELATALTPLVRALLDLKRARQPILAPASPQNRP
jgi:DNA-binding NarL/FixJ family response regulator